MPDVWVNKALYKDVKTLPSGEAGILKMMPRLGSLEVTTNCFNRYPIELYSKIKTLMWPNVDSRGQIIADYIRDVQSASSAPRVTAIANRLHEKYNLNPSEVVRYDPKKPKKVIEYKETYAPEEGAIKDEEAAQLENLAEW